MGIRIADFEPERHGEAVFNLRVATFSSATNVPYDPEEVYIPTERRLVALDGERLVGSLGIWDFDQSFGGQPVPMGGVAGVVVAPTHRGQGVGSLLVGAGIQRMRELGDAISTLYPATVPLYRRWGWEIAGVRVRRTVVTRSLMSLPRPSADSRIREASEQDLSKLAAIADGVAATEAGGLVGGDRWAQRNFTPDPDDGDVAHVVERGGDLVGFVQTEKNPADDDRSAWVQDVYRLYALDHDAELALWRFLGGSYSVAADTRYVSRPADTLLWDLSEIDIQNAPVPQHWMTRVLDPEKAVAARGFPTGLDVTVPIEIVDGRVPEAGGKFVFEVASGRGALTPGGDGRVQIDTRMFAALFTGFAPARQLRQRGVLGAATDDDVAALAAAFDGPTPFLRDYF